MKLSKILSLALPLAIIAGAAHAQDAYEAVANGMDRLHEAAEKVKSSTAAKANAETKKSDTSVKDKIKADLEAKKAEYKAQQEAKKAELKARQEADKAAGEAKKNELKAKGDLLKKDIKDLKSAW